MTRAESIVRALVKALREDFAERVTRGKAHAWAETDEDMADVAELSDEIARSANDKHERALTVEVTLLSRGDAARERLDTLRAMMHRRVFADATFATVRQAVADQGAEWESDHGAALLRQKYRFTYRCDAADLETS